MQDEDEHESLDGMEQARWEAQKDIGNRGEREGGRESESELAITMIVVENRQDNTTQHKGQQNIYVQKHLTHVTTKPNLPSHSLWLPVNSFPSH